MATNKNIRFLTVQVRDYSKNGPAHRRTNGPLSRVCTCTRGPTFTASKPFLFAVNLGHPAHPGRSGHTLTMGFAFKEVTWMPLKPH